MSIQDSTSLTRDRASPDPVLQTGHVHQDGNNEHEHGHHTRVRVDAPELDALDDLDAVLGVLRQCVHELPLPAQVLRILEQVAHAHVAVRRERRRTDTLRVHIGVVRLDQASADAPNRVDVELSMTYPHYGEIPARAPPYNPVCDENTILKIDGNLSTRNPPNALDREPAPRGAAQIVVGLSELAQQRLVVPRAPDLHRARIVLPEDLQWELF